MSCDVKSNQGQLEATTKVKERIKSEQRKRILIFLFAVYSFLRIFAA